MVKIIQRFICDTSGATTVEYALVVAGLSAAIATVTIRLAFR
jgi:Flp pilus assembly pilin Flp